MERGSFGQGSFGPGSFGSGSFSQGSSHPESPFMGWYLNALQFGNNSIILWPLETYPNPDFQKKSNHPIARAK